MKLSSYTSIIPNWSFVIFFSNKFSAWGWGFGLGVFSFSFACGIRYGLELFVINFLFVLFFDSYCFYKHFYYLIKLS